MNDVKLNKKEEELICGSDSLKNNGVDNGNLVACRCQDLVYLIQEGMRHLIPNQGVYNVLFKDRSYIRFVEQQQLDMIPLGDKLSNDTCLIKGDCSCNIYLYYNSVKSYIRSVNDFNAAGFRWDRVIVYKQEKINQIKTIHDFIIEKNKSIMIDSNEIPHDFDKDNSYSGILTNFTYTSKSIGRTGWVLLPEDYKYKKYPVLYLYHGLGRNAEWPCSSQGRIKQIIGNMIAKEMIGEMVVVMPDIMISHTREMQVEDFHLFNNTLPDLMKYVNDNFNVLTEAKKTAIAGISLGATAVLYNAWCFRNLFHVVGAFSPNYMLLPNRKASISQGWISKKEEFVLGTGREYFTFIANGTRDEIFAKYYSDVLTENEVDHIFALFPNGEHNWDTFKKLFYVFMSYDFFNKY